MHGNSTGNIYFSSENTTRRVSNRAECPGNRLLVFFDYVENSRVAGEMHRSPCLPGDEVLEYRVWLRTRLTYQTYAPQRRAANLPLSTHASVHARHECGPSNKQVFWGVGKTCRAEERSIAGYFKLNNAHHGSPTSRLPDVRDTFETLKSSAKDSTKVKPDCPPPTVGP